MQSRDTIMGDLGGLAPVIFSKRTKVLFFIVTLCSKQNIPCDLKGMAHKKIRGLGPLTPFLCLPRVEKGVRMVMKLVGLQRHEIRKTPAVFLPFMNLTNSIPRPYFIVESFSMPFLVEWTSAVQNSWLRVCRGNMFI